MRHTIFKTEWGWFGLAGTESALCRTCLPLAERKTVKSHLLKDLLPMNRDSSIKFDKTLFRTVQEQIIAYFEGTRINFGQDIPIVLDGFSPFAVRVLTGCREVTFGRTINYGQLAKKIGRPGTARAVGSALAKNPLPLIIPCHRVIRSDGRIGGFSATGGTKLKNRMLKLESASNLRDAM